MKTVLAIDPGLRGCGCAVFVDGTLSFAWYERNPVKKGGGPVAWFALGWAVARTVGGEYNQIDEYVIEVPQIYRYSKGDPNDLIEIAGVGAAIGTATRARNAQGFKPREWKGQVEKSVFTQRIISRLTPEERDVNVKLPAPSLAHNVWDAVGLGLFFLGRLGQKAA